MPRKKRRKGTPKASGLRTHKAEPEYQSSVKVAKLGTKDDRNDTVAKVDEGGEWDNASMATNSFMQANYHSYKPLDEAWRSMDRVFGDPNEADLKFLDKLCDNQLKSVAVFSKNNMSSFDDTQVSTLSTREEVMDSAKRHIMSSSVCPPPISTLGDDWIDPIHERNWSLMQVVASRGSADEVLSEEVNDCQKSLLKRKTSLFERSMIETECVDIKDREVVNLIGQNWGQIELELKSYEEQRARANSGAKEIGIPKILATSSCAQSSLSSFTPKTKKFHSRGRKPIQPCAETPESHVEMEEALCGREIDPAIDLCAVTRLGKRDRLYLDVWKEQDFLERTKQRHLFEPLFHWTDLLKNYSDNHDGSYRMWMLGQIRPRNRYAVPGRKSSYTKGGAVIIPPPVPAAVHHPAAWGLHSRSYSSSSKSKFENFHPAAFTKKRVHPPGSFIKLELDDVDDLNIELEHMRQQLLKQESSNYLLLRNIRDVSKRLHKSSVLRVRREALEKSVFSAFKSTHIHSKSFMGHNVYPFRQPTDSMGNQGTTPSFFDKTEGSNTLSLLGACPCSHVPHGEAVAHLQVGDYVDAMLSCSEGEGVTKKWTACMVRDIHTDQNILMRSVKVAPLGGLCAGNAQWMAVEDGRLAPIHSHTVSSNFLELLKRKAEQTKTERIFHEKMTFELAFEDLTGLKSETHDV
jgi:hypothetical protein